MHEDGFRVEARRDGTFTFFSPEGWPLGEGPSRMEVELDDPAVGLVRSNRRRGLAPPCDESSARYPSEARILRRLLFRAWEAVESG